MATIREILTPILGPEALADAEGRVYDRLQTRFRKPRFACADGLCAVGAMARAAGIPLNSEEERRYPSAGAIIAATIAIDVRVSGWRQPAIATPLHALQRIIALNDSGTFTSPGSLTAYLDTAYVA